MEHKGTETLKTNRLLLRKHRFEDAKALFETGYFGSSIEDAENIINNIMKYNDDPTSYNWVITSGNTAVGRIKVTEYSSRDNYMQIGYDTNHLYRNRGFMTEALKEVIRFLLTEVGIHRLYGQARIHNIASVKTMQKAGMVFEGRQRKHYREPDGTYVDVDIYGVIQEDMDSVF